MEKFFGFNYSQIDLKTSCDVDLTTFSFVIWILI